MLAALVVLVLWDLRWCSWSYQNWFPVCAPFTRGRGHIGFPLPGRGLPPGRLTWGCTGRNRLFWPGYCWKLMASYILGTWDDLKLAKCGRIKTVCLQSGSHHRRLRYRHVRMRGCVAANRLQILIRRRSDELEVFRYCLGSFGVFPFGRPGGALYGRWLMMLSLVSSPAGTC